MQSSLAEESDETPNEEANDHPEQQSDHPEQEHQPASRR